MTVKDLIQELQKYVEENIGGHYHEMVWVSENGAEGKLIKLGHYFQVSRVDFKRTFDGERPKCFLEIEYTLPNHVVEAQQRWYNAVSGASQSNPSASRDSVRSTKMLR